MMAATVLLTKLTMQGLPEVAEQEPQDQTEQLLAVEQAA
jgi:hypothetical protein